MNDLRENPQLSIAKNVVFNILFVVICIFLAHSLSAYFFTTVPVVGGSMQPNYQHGDRVLLLRTGSFNHGDVVVFRDPDESFSNRHLIKRIIGLPGDSIEIRKVDEVFYIYRNEVRLNEPYLDGAVAFEPMQALVVPNGQFFYLGDNRGNSTDSRPIFDVTIGDHIILLGNLNDIVGRVILRFNGFNFEAIRR
jgi:signal peptidase I